MERHTHSACEVYIQYKVISVTDLMRISTARSLLGQNKVCDFVLVDVKR